MNRKNIRMVSHGYHYFFVRPGRSGNVHRSGGGRGRSLDTTWRAQEMTEDFVVVDTRGKELVSGKAGDYLVISEMGKYNYGMNGGTPRRGWYNSGLKFEVVKKGDEEFAKFVALKAVARKALRS
jgi:hypothetical protein